MNTKLSNNIKSLLKQSDFNLEHESKMVQARILSTILEIIDDKNLTQLDLEELTGLKQPFLSGLFNQHKKLNMEHIALFQNALRIKLQPPAYLNEEEHYEKYYSEDGYEPVRTYFPDSFTLKDERIISWINKKNNKYIIDKEGYSVIESGSLTDQLFEPNIEYYEHNETY
ncbi:transcriptional regulator [Arenibacter certesii]|nr:transcriptional regulator [Arenibacter certesii]